jgi:hypothetical protein
VNGCESIAGNTPPHPVRLPFNLAARAEVSSLTCGRGCGPWLLGAARQVARCRVKWAASAAAPVIIPTVADAASALVPAWTARPSTLPIGTLLTTAKAPAMVRN